MTMKKIMMIACLLTGMVFANYQAEHYEECDETRQYQYLQVDADWYNFLRSKFMDLPFQPLLQGMLIGDYPCELCVVAHDNNWVLIQSSSSYVYLAGYYLQDDELDLIWGYLESYKKLIIVCHESLQAYFVKKGLTIQPRIEFKHYDDFASNELEIPQGFSVQRLDMQLFRQSPWYGFLASIAGGPAAFLEKSFGYALVDADGNSVAQAYGAFIGDNECEIGIVTHPDYRGKGYITYPLQAVIDECIERDITPMWSCNSENIASLKTAMKFGFTIHRHYVFLKNC